jgi:hypothetical protein
MPIWGPTWDLGPARSAFRHDDRSLRRSTVIISIRPQTDPFSHPVKLTGLSFVPPHAESPEWIASRRESMSITVVIQRN